MCSCFAAAVEPLFACSPTMGKDTGWHKNDFREENSSGGRIGSGAAKPLEAYEVQLLMAAGDVGVPCARGADVAASERAEVINLTTKKHGVTPCVPRKTSAYCGSMVEFRYRGRKISQEDILYIRALIEQHLAGKPPHTLDQALVKPGSGARPMVRCATWQCRGLVACMLQRAGEIALPPVKYVRHNPLARRARPKPLLIDTTPIEGELRELGPVDFQLVRRTGDEPLFNSLLEQHHYLKYEQPVGASLKYLIWAQSRPIACLAWSSAPRHLGARDRYLGWSAEARRRNVRFLAYNPRFLILPWVRVKHLASHILGRMAARSPQTGRTSTVTRCTS